MRRFLLAFLIVTLAAPDALAANPPPLAPGKPAGLRQARLEDGTGMIVVAGVALVGVAVALATAGNGSASPNTNPATSTTSTTP